MPTAQQLRTKGVRALLCGDIHLSHAPPVARSGEPCWYNAMKRSLQFLAELAEDCQAPILCAGDVFHTWRSPVELVNWATKWMPRMIAIPGQHDLPFHDLQQIKKSPFWSLVLTLKLDYLPPALPVDTGALVLCGFPWGVPITKVNGMPERRSGTLRVALVHDYVWSPNKSNTSFPGAPKEKSAEARIESGVLDQFDLVVFGDNHRPFALGNIYNCGGFLRRNLDERDHQPTVGLLYEDGTVRRVPIPTDKDAEMVDVRAAAQTVGNAVVCGLEPFLQQLAGMSVESQDFGDVVQQLLTVASGTISSGVRKYIQEAMDAGGQTRAKK